MDHESVPGGVGVFRWSCLQGPSCSNTQCGWEEVVYVGECTCVCMCMRHCVACEHTTHLLKACSCQVMLAAMKSDTAAGAVLKLRS